MTVDSVTAHDVERALREMSRLLVGTCDDLDQATARAEAAEAEIDGLVVALADLLLAFDEDDWEKIDVAAKNARRAMLGVRGERVAR